MDDVRYRNDVTGVQPFQCLSIVPRSGALRQSHPTLAIRSSRGRRDAPESDPGSSLVSGQVWTEISTRTEGYHSFYSLRCTLIRCDGHVFCLPFSGKSPPMWVSVDVLARAFAMLPTPSAFDFQHRASWIELICRLLETVCISTTSKSSSTSFKPSNWHFPAQLAQAQRNQPHPPSRPPSPFLSSS